jgi:hypothetical protein
LLKKIVENTKLIFWLALAFKVIAGLFLGWVYQNLYVGGDTIAYFTDANYLIQLAKGDFPIFLDFMWSSSKELSQCVFCHLSLHNPRALLMSKITAIVSLFGFGNYWLTSSWFSLFSFSGLWALSKRLKQLFPNLKLAIYLSLFFIPTFVFWTSGVMKESVIIGCWSWLIAWFLELVYSLKSSKNQVKKAFKALLSIWFFYILFQMKYYYLGALLPALVILISGKLIDKYFTWSNGQKLFGLGLVGVCIILLASFIHPNLRLGIVTEIIVENNLKMVSQTTDSTNLISFQNLSADLPNLSKNAVIGFWEGLFRPYLWESGHLLKKWTALENAILLVLSALFFIQIIRKKVEFNYPNLFLAVGFYIILLAILLPLSAPNLGNLMRYRVAYIPFIWIMVLGSFLRSRKKNRIVQNK